VAFSPDGATLAAATSNNQVTLWNLADPARPRVMSEHQDVREVAFSPRPPRRRRSSPTTATPRTASWRPSTTTGTSRSTAHTTAAAFGLALLSAVAGFGGGVLLLPVFTVLFGLRAAVPTLTLTQRVTGVAQPP